MAERTDPFPHERMFATIAIGILDRGEQLPPNLASACAIGLYRHVRDMEAEPCEHLSMTGVPGVDSMSRCDECGEWAAMHRDQP